ncbi:hypothetical protein, partial [uncultured Prevotella sp.]|uniref:hypothetical protein n=1 Tax=uncultured Prevotella sp. TaxID=159272 RepID=UPI0025961647
PKTRQSDSFSAILGFTENQRYGQLLLISTKLNKFHQRAIICVATSGKPISEKHHYNNGKHFSVLKLLQFVI